MPCRWTLLRDAPCNRELDRSLASLVLRSHDARNRRLVRRRYRHWRSRVWLSSIRSGTHIDVVEHRKAVMARTRPLPLDLICLDSKARPGQGSPAFGMYGSWRNLFFRGHVRNGVEFVRGFEGFQDLLQTLVWQSVYQNMARNAPQDSPLIKGRGIGIFRIVCQIVNPATRLETAGPTNADSSICTRWVVDPSRHGVFL